MKSIQNKSVTIKAPNGTEVVETYAQLLVSCINQMPERGFTTEEMKKRLRIFDAIERAEKAHESTPSEDFPIQLEDSDHAVAVACVKAMRWSVLSRGIVEFCDYIERI